MKTLVNANQKLTQATQDSQIVDKGLYQSAVESQINLFTCPDISFAVSNVAKFYSRPTKEHWTAVKRIMRYLKGTTSYGLLYSETSSKNSVATQMLIGVVILITTDQYQVMFFNSEELRSVGKSKKQSSVALSTAEAKYIALLSATQESS